MLFIIPTPIGNLKDMTYRAVEVLSAVNLILAEDTRTSKRLLDHYQIETPLKSFHAHNEHAQLEYVIDLMKGGQELALISDAGTPGISDPGFLLARACHENEIPVVCLPGATAVIPAVVSSGLPSDKFHFEGFLPHKKGRQTRLIYLSKLKETFVLYESPHRLVKCLKQLKEYCGKERKACVCREISKIHEEINLNNIENLILDYEARDKVKGEIVIVVHGDK